MKSRLKKIAVLALLILAIGLIVSISITTFASQETPTPTPVAKPPLVDIDNHWAKTYIQGLYDAGIVLGYEIENDHYFKPDNNITRAEFSVLLAKAKHLQIVENPQFNFADKDSIPEWAAGYVKSLVDKGIIIGYTDGTFKPSNE